MPYLDNRNSIIEALKSNPEGAVRLWVEGGHERVANDAMDAARKAGVSIRVIPKDQFSHKFKEVKSHVCLESAEFAFTDTDTLLGAIPDIELPFFAAFDGVYDPQNLGNIIRTAACFNLDGLIIPKDRACSVTETVINVARGGAGHIRISRATNLPNYIEALKKQNVFCFGFDEKGEKDLFDMDLTMPICLVLGGEDGLRRLMKDRCDMVLKIPTSKDFSSLNVANAFAIAAYEVVRQRRKMGK